jgi:hypothetical protein
MADKMTYFQDQRTGICFAVIASEKSGDFKDSGMGITAVSCSDSVLGLIKEK